MKPSVYDARTRETTDQDGITEGTPRVQVRAAHRVSSDTDTRLPGWLSSARPRQSGAVSWRILEAQIGNLFIFIFKKKQNFKNICRIVKFSKMGALMGDRT